ncbi:Arm DNA-binding domain-containing protein [Chryseobacterium populi]
MKNNPEMSTIYMRITVGGKRNEISTGQIVKTLHWNIKLGKISGNNPQSKQLNGFLEGVCAKLFKCYREKTYTCRSL